MHNRNNLSDGKTPIGTWNKYTSKNPVQKFLVWNFFKTIKSIVQRISKEVDTALDVGCGEGRITKLLSENGLKKVKGCDFTETILEIARKENSKIFFYKKNIYDLDTEDSVDLITACEVLEHLELPDLAVRNLAMATKEYCLLSVPDEPLFRILNFCGGKYWKNLGNPPGHLNHWSKGSFLELIERHFEVKEVKRATPWLIILAKPIPTK